MPDDIHFDTTVEQRLLSAHQDWLANRQEFLVQWNQVQDVLVVTNSALTLGLAGAVMFLAYRVSQLEDKINAGS